MTRTRVVDPKVNHHRAMVMVAFRRGDEEQIEHHRRELAQARIVAEAKKVAARLPELSPERLAEVRALLGGA